MSLWNWIIRKTSTTTPVAVEEMVDTKSLFIDACAEIGIGTKILVQTNAIELFNDWYDGDPTKEAVSNSIKDFAEAHGGAINAKFARFIK